MGGALERMGKIRPDRLWGPRILLSNAYRGEG
jgi:hypothetical protein